MSRALVPALCCAFLAACSTPMTDLQPGQRPPAASAEAGFWMQMDRAERELKTSASLITDPVVTSYVQALACTLAGEHCDGVRTYVVQTPEFNATMGPNGALQVWGGLILRAENEAQLAFVIGHEIAHFQRRHTLQRWQDARAKTDLVAWVELVSAVAGYGFVGSVARLGTMVSLLQFNREQEREADELGLRMLARAGYDPREAARIWEALHEELEYADEKQPIAFLSTHPSTAERMRYLRQQGEQLATAANHGALETERFRGVLQRIRGPLLRDELRQRRFQRSELLLARLLEIGHAPAEVEFYRGELCRLRDGSGDRERAIAHYEGALELPDAPAETYRALGLLHRERADRVQARRYLEQYLASLPQAQDRQMIEAYLEELR